MKKMRALIIGAGRIGAFFDTPMSKNIITHAHAYKIHSHFELVGFYDVDQKISQKAAKIWGCKSFNNLDEALSGIDIVSICVPDESHYKIMKEIVIKPIKLIFCEKPITKSPIEAKEIIKLVQKNKISLLVNYSRRFVPEFIKLQKDIKEGLFGNFVCGNGYYGKGLVHNGSHMIDLIRFLLGEIKDSSVIDKINDFYQDDPTVTARLIMKNNSILNILALNCAFYTIFELDLLFEKGRIIVKDSGNILEYYRPKSSPEFKGYQYLILNKKIKTSLNKAIYQAITNIYDVLYSNKAMLCPANEDYNNLKEVIKIKAAK